jgi:hypothetical protein
VTVIEHEFYTSTSGVSLPRAETPLRRITRGAGQLQHAASRSRQGFQLLDPSDVDVDPTVDLDRDPSKNFSTRIAVFPEGPRARSTIESTSTSPFTSTSRVNVEVKVKVDDPDL